MNTFIRSLAGVGMTILLASCGGGSDSSEQMPDEDPPVTTGDPGVLAFSAPSYLVSESPGLRDEILVTRTGGTAGIVTAKISFSSGSATVDEDFENKELLVRFGDGSSAPRLVRLPVVPDGDDESDETLTAMLHSPEGCVILGDQSTAEVTILDDDDPAAGVISFTSDSYDVDESAGVATVALQRTGGNFGVIAATMNTADGTAASAIDYGAVSAVVAFQDGDSAQKTVQIPILDNTQPEADKTVLLSLVSSDSSVIGTPDAAVLTIRDDDQPEAGSVEFGASSYTVAEGAGSVTVEVTRAGGTSGAVTVELTTTDNSATAGDDYESLQTTVSFADGDAAAKSVDIVILDDPDDEGDQIFDVGLSNPTGGAVLGAQAAVPVVITDNDGAPTLPPGAPTLGVSSAPKQLVFDWTTVPDATLYRLMMDPTGTSGFSQIGADIALGETMHFFPIAAHLLDWENARFLLQACNSGGCTDSNVVSVETLMLGAIGFFKASNTEGSQQRSPDGGDQFGWAVALSGDGQTLAVTAYDEDSNATFLNGDQSDNSETDAGAVYVFSADQTGWIQQAYMKAPNTDNSDRFGSALALSADGNTLAVGATGEGSNAVGVNGDQSNNDASTSGAVYIYTRSGTVWTLQAYLKASNTESQDRFGHAVALSDDGNTLAVGALGEASAADGIGADQSNNNAAGAGAVYLFTRTGGTWAQQEYLKASNSETDDRFGNAVALSGDGTMLAVGAP